MRKSEEPPQAVRGQSVLAKLRRLLIEPEQIDIILERLNNPRIRAREMSRSLPEAIRLRMSEDESLTKALRPAIVTAFHDSIKKDPRPVVEAIFPVIGPAIRRSISTTLSGMVQSFDQSLKHSLSWRGWKWRLEALRTGKSFAEVVLYHTLIYRVEQVFLIHEKSGLLLQHVAAGLVSTRDAEIVSGMLTAIQEAIRNFARDSFGSGGEEPFEKIDFGDREVWFEAGPYAVLAVVILGHAPESFRNDLMKPVIEAIHLEMSETLDNFDGDAMPFEMVRHHLERCLQASYLKDSGSAGVRIPASILFVSASLFAALAFWGFSNMRGKNSWDNYINKLKSTTGVVVIETGARDGKYYISGLRDSLSEDPERILREEFQLDPHVVISRWDRYLSLDPWFVRQRSINILKPPPSVAMKVENGALIASGSAPHFWITDARRLAPVIPGVVKFDDRALIDEELKEIESLRAKVEKNVFRFRIGSSRFLASQKEELDDLIPIIRGLITHATAVKKDLRIYLTGRTDSMGDEKTNLPLSMKRAERISSLLAASGIDQDLIISAGVGAKEPLRAEKDEADRTFNRSVSIKISLKDLPHNERSQ